MKTTIFLFTITLIIFSLAGCTRNTARTNRSEKPKVTFEKLAGQFQQPDRIYAPFTFWFWDTPLDNPETRQRMLTMAQTMMQQNLNPGYAHGRMCMSGMPDLPLDQWLSGYWFAAFTPILNAAKSKDYYFAYCDEYWWPTGRAAGRVLKNNPDLWAVSLSWQTIDLAGGERVSVPESFFAVAARLAGERSLEKLKNARSQSQALAAKESLEVVPHVSARIESGTLQVIGAGRSFAWQAPGQGNWRIYVFNRYYHPGADGGRLNYLDPRVAPAFINYAHQPYLEKFGSPLGNRIPGVFTDHEGDYGYKLAWSQHLKEFYKAKYGEGIEAQLPLLIDIDEEGKYARTRWRWFDAVSDIYSGFFKNTNRWLAEQGMYCISNLWEENLMWQAGAVGDFFKLQRVFSMPGTDCLGLSILNVHDFKETQSVCEFEGRRMQSEIMGAAGWPSFTPVTIKQAANAAVTWGISHVVPHGIFTTRKLSGNPWIPDWFAENPMWPYLHLWTTFVQRGSYINSHGRSAADVLLLSPMESVWEQCGPGVFDPAYKGRVPGPAVQPLQTEKDIEQTMEKLKERSAWWTPPVMEKWFSDRVRKINNIYSRAMADLTAGRIEYLVADRYYMNQMQLKNGKLTRGSFSFKTVIIPPMTLMSLDVAEKIAAFADSGGCVYYLGELPEGSCENGMNDTKMIGLMEYIRQLPGVKFCSNGLLPEIQDGVPGLRAHIQFLSGSFPMLQQHRRIDGRDFFWLVNNTGDTRECALQLTDLAGRLSLWDCESGQIYELAYKQTERGIEVKLPFEGYQAFWLVVDPEKDGIEYNPMPENDLEKVLNIDGVWTVKIDTTVQPDMEFPYKSADMYTNGEGVKHSLGYWDAWNMQSFSGYVDYYSTFELKKVKDKMVLDLGTVWHMAQVWINGQEAGRRLWPPYRFDITGIVREGRNDLKIRVGNLISNSYGQPKESGLIGPVVVYQ